MCHPRVCVRRVPRGVVFHPSAATARRGSPARRQHTKVLRALLKTFRMTSDPAQVSQMRGTIDAIWPVFDDDGSGTIEQNEFLKPSEGLADTIVATLGLQ